MSMQTTTHVNNTRSSIVCCIGFEVGKVTSKDTCPKVLLESSVEYSKRCHNMDGYSAGQCDLLVAFREDVEEQRHAFDRVIKAVVDRAGNYTTQVTVHAHADVEEWLVKFVRGEWG